MVCYTDDEMMEEEEYKDELDELLDEADDEDDNDDDIEVCAVLVQSERLRNTSHVLLNMLINTCSLEIMLFTIAAL